MKRRKAREYVLQFLYGIEFTEIGNLNSEELKDRLNRFWKATKEKDRDIKEFAAKIIIGTLANFQDIDLTIQSAAKNWKLDRMASIDRNILRFATYELIYEKDIPPAVTINEAIELAKIFSTLESASFINGILDKILKTQSSSKKETEG